jgi:hypothetical protein
MGKTKKKMRKTEQNKNKNLWKTKKIVGKRVYIIYGMKIRNLETEFTEFCINLFR